MHALHTPTVRPLPEAFDWEGLAWLMGIPQHNRPYFIRWLMAAVEKGGNVLPSYQEGPRAPIDADIARTGRAFIRAIGQLKALSPSDLKMSMVVGRYLQHVKAPSRGAPKRADRFFLECMLYITCVLGGRVTFNRPGKGNIVDLLDELRPLMPVKFIRNALPMSTIELLATQARERGRRIASELGASATVEAISRHAYEAGQRAALDAIARQSSRAASRQAALAGAA